MKREREKTNTEIKTSPVLFVSLLLVDLEYDQRDVHRRQKQLYTLREFSVPFIEL